MRTLIISLVVALAGCDLYYGSDSQGSHGKHHPDAGPCCTIDAGVFHDGPPEIDAGSCHGGSDGGVLPDASVILPDAASYPDAAHH